MVFEALESQEVPFDKGFGAIRDVFVCTCYFPTRFIS